MPVLPPTNPARSVPNRWAPGDVSIGVLAEDFADKCSNEVMKQPSQMCGQCKLESFTGLMQRLLVLIFKVCRIRC